MKILVTGACGYKGHILIPKLLARDYEVIAFDLQWFGNYLVPQKNLSVIKGDVRNIETISLAGVDCIIHLSAMNEVESLKDPVGALQVNGIQSLMLLQAAQKTRVKRFIYFSTAHVYGFPLEGHIDEKNLLMAILYAVIIPRCL